MYTLFIRYTLDPNQLEKFKTYVESELHAIRSCGGDVLGYWLPTDFAGPTNVAYGLIDFSTLTCYEQYRKTLADHPAHRRNAEELTRNCVILNTERSIMKKYSGRKSD